jgi:ribosomal protein S4
VRQSWNKYNLYNLFKLKIPNHLSRTYFQQKWAAKAMTRAYHGGDYIKESHWTRMFSRRLQSVINMQPEYMALHDGSEQAAGRGSGLHLAQPSSRLPVESRVEADEAAKKLRRTQASTNKSKADRYDDMEAGITYRLGITNAVNQHRTPYMQMAFAPLERRLDTAIYRALFATSPRQARQFVIHGFVKVNGQVVSLS